MSVESVLSLISQLRACGLLPADAYLMLWDALEDYCQKHAHRKAKS